MTAYAQTVRESLVGSCVLDAVTKMDALRRAPGGRRLVWMDEVGPE